MLELARVVAELLPLSPRRKAGRLESEVSAAKRTDEVEERPMGPDSAPLLTVVTTMAGVAVAAAVAEEEEVVVDGGGVGRFVAVGAA